MISELSQDEEPPQFYGGIIADPMGLGKTLTMIALVATDIEKRNDGSGTQRGSNYVDATLIIVPPSCMLFDAANNERILMDSSAELLGRPIVRVC